MSKTAVVLFNLGGPDKPESIRPFLFNFFMDKNIIRAPLPVRWLVATLIANRRSRREAGDSYALLGGASPLLKNTQAQTAALEKVLGPGFKVFVCMRYWHPQAEEVARQVKGYAPDHIVLLPLYPQFSTTTTRSSFQSWDRAAKAADLTATTARVCCYPLDEGFISASAALVRGAYERAVADTQNDDRPLPRVLFSAHGLPEDVINDGDPYQWQCEQSARAIAARTGIAGLDWVICYQSRVGPKKWIGPSTGDALRAAAADKVPVIIYPHAFVSEHVETLVEIEIEYRHMAEEWGVPYFMRVPTVGTQPAFIEGLAALVRKNISAAGIVSETGKRLCPQEWRRCCMSGGRS